MSTRLPLILIVLAALLVLAVLLALGVGSTTHSPLRVLALFTGQGTAQEIDALWQVRLPRVLCAIGCGVALAVAGTLLQALTRNPLADSGILGINAGAGLGMILLVASYPSRNAAPMWLLPLAAAAGGLITAALVQALAWRGGLLPPIRLLLVGVAVGATASAAMLVVALGIDGSLLRFVVAWQAGTLSGRDLGNAALILPLAGAGVIAALGFARRLDVLALGDETATGLGMPVGATQAMIVAIAAILAAGAVAVAGNLGFVGLIAPHLGRVLVGPQTHRLVPTAALIGAGLVVLADVAARTVAAPIELPTGIVVALIGAPFLLVILARWSRP